MCGLWVLLLLILVSALPVLAVFIWFRVGKYPITIPAFLLSLLGGAAAILIAALVQGFFPQDTPSGFRAILFKLFVQVSLIEEGSRLVVILLFLWFGKRFPKAPPYTPGQGAILGLLTGLGFAVIENASYGAADMGIALLRAVTAAPLHGACGGRVGIAAVQFADGTQGRPIPRFLSAVTIHGMYDFMVVSPGFPAAVPVLLALVSLIPTIQMIRTGRVMTAQPLD
jgi:RsiW-degrading membrane proteinase PrsW (M82 family)